MQGAANRVRVVTQRRSMVNESFQLAGDVPINKDLNDDLKSINGFGIGSVKSKRTQKFKSHNSFSKKERERRRRAQNKPEISPRIQEHIKDIQIDIRPSNPF